MRQRKLHPVLGLIFGAFLISFSAVFVKAMDVASTPAAFYRVLFGGLILLVMHGRRLRNFWQDSIFIGFAALAGLFFAADLAFWHQSIEYVGPGLATILGNFQVFFLAAFGVIIYQERMTFRLGSAFVLAMGGLFLIFGLDWSQLSGNYKIGIVLGLATAICYASYVLVLRKLQFNTAGHSAGTILAVVSLVSAFFLGIIALMQEQSFVIPDVGNFGYLIAYAVFSQVIGWILISKSLPEIDVSRTGLILLLQPGLAFVWDILFFNRPTKMIEIIGAIIALVAIYLGTVSKAGTRKMEQADVS
ncbi:MAG: hypothetical protein MAGBODY4_00980 [Candidatus Marinimicrobia bacterium]|nr:hypothetical protein [Candidatus Neomarinimicrobiota bacterium]